ncbi:MAG: hypothetical protein WAT39_02500 [Planctomycetota bacterium]
MLLVLRTASHATGEWWNEWGDEHMAASSLIFLLGCVVGLATGGFAGGWVGRKLFASCGSSVDGGGVR